MKTIDKSAQSVGARLAALGVALAVVIADQLTKLAAVKALVHVSNSRVAIPGVLNFTYILNSGATNGILAGHRWVFMTVSTVVIIGIAVYVALGKVRSNLTAISLAMVVGGGIGNMIDRVARGTVVDFLDVTCFDFFPFNTVFNVADVFVCVGCGLLILSVILSEIKDRKKKNEETPADAGNE